MLLAVAIIAVCCGGNHVRLLVGVYLGCMALGLIITGLGNLLDVLL